MNYPFMEPPFEFESFEKMTKKEAQLHYDWYMEEVPKRLELLKMAYVYTGGGDKEDLDFTPLSLVNLWKWFLLQIESAPKSAEDLAEERLNAPDWLHESLMENTEKPSEGTVCIAMDIAIYFNEVLIRNHGDLSWGYRTKPKTVEYLNRPVTIGFSNTLTLDPREILYNLTLRSINGESDEKALYNLYKAWSEFV
ncbi:hypothetical protein ACTL32_08595 [Planococcus sp. FY231025]|uniref:hypothetical protein n=1 Tax=Planococcus sp. FY231025 TaxID=3455699 RepID=UPI003F8F8486